MHHGPNELRHWNLEIGQRFLENVSKQEEVSYTALFALQCRKGFQKVDSALIVERYKVGCQLAPFAAIGGECASDCFEQATSLIAANESFSIRHGSLHLARVH